MRRSGLQTDVLVLYRQLLKTAVRIDDETRSLRKHVSFQFRLQAEKVDRKDFRAIEHYLRHGYKQKKLMEMPGFRFARTNL